MSFMPTWRNSGHDQEDVVISTRIRLARNLKDHCFPGKMNKEEAQAVENQIVAGAEHLPMEYAHQKLSRMDKNDAKVLMEHHLISPELIKQREISSYFLREDQRINLMVNEEDHLRLQVLTGGLNLEDSYRLASVTDDILSESLDYAFSLDYGYLTACPTNVGTGLRASLMVCLPGIVANNQLKSWIDSLGKLGVIVRGMYGEGSGVYGDMYQISNQRTLGFKEEDMIGKLSSMMKNLLQEEREYRNLILERKGHLWVEDRVYRSLGLLSHARTMEEKEAINHLSNLRLGISLNMYSGKTLEEIDEMIFHVGHASIAQYQERLNTDMRIEALRAYYLRKSFI